MEGEENIALIKEERGGDEPGSCVRALQLGEREETRDVFKEEEEEEDLNPLWERRYSWMAFAQAESLGDPLASPFTFNLSVGLCVVMVAMGFFQVGIISSIIYSLMLQKKMSIAYLIWMISTSGFVMFVSLQLHSALWENYNPDLFPERSIRSKIWKIKTGFFWTFRKAFILAIVCYNVGSFMLLLSHSPGEMLVSLVFFSFFFGTVLSNAAPYIHLITITGYLEEAEVVDDSEAQSGEQLYFCLRRFDVDFEHNSKRLLYCLSFFMVPCGNMWAFGGGTLGTTLKYNVMGRMFYFYLSHIFCSLLVMALVISFFLDPAVQRKNDAPNRAQSQIRSWEEREGDQIGDTDRENGSKSKDDALRMDISLSEKSAVVLAPIYITGFLLVEVLSVALAAQNHHLDIEEISFLEFALNLTAALFTINLVFLPRFSFSPFNGLPVSFILLAGSCLVLRHPTKGFLQDDIVKLLTGLFLSRISLAIFMKGYFSLYYRIEVRNSKCNPVRNPILSHLFYTTLYGSICIGPLLGLWVCNHFSVSLVTSWSPHCPSYSMVLGLIAGLQVPLVCASLVLKRTLFGGASSMTIRRDVFEDNISGYREVLLGEEDDEKRNEMQIT
eukprot:Nk52_evm1s2101 gene=Nk52_evmTU1s2101